MFRAVTKLTDLPIAAALSAGLAFSCTSAWALGGGAARPDGGLASHLVMVLSKQGNKHGACTGTVIAPTIILTAAHCVAGNRQVVVAYKEGGSHVLQRVAARALNPGFSATARVSIDMALIRLDSPLPARFRPMSLEQDDTNHQVGVTRVVAGFGLAIDRDESTAGVLRSASVSVLPRLYPSYLRLGHRVDADLDDFAVCTGDSGGPVLNGNVVVAVVYGREKFGSAQSCGTTAQAVRVAPQRRWIDQVIRGWTGQRVSGPLSLVD